MPFVGAVFEEPRGGSQDAGRTSALLRQVREAKMQNINQSAQQQNAQQLASELSTSRQLRVAPKSMSYSGTQAMRLAHDNIGRNLT